MNMFGSSPYSELLRVGVGNQAPTPNNLHEIKSSCGPTFITVTWNSVSSTDLPILGY